MRSLILGLDKPRAVKAVMRTLDFREMGVRYDAWLNRTRVCHTVSRVVCAVCESVHGTVVYQPECLNASMNHGRITRNLDPSIRRLLIRDLCVCPCVSVGISS